MGDDVPPLANPNESLSDAELELDDLVPDKTVLKVPETIAPVIPVMPVAPTELPKETPAPSTDEPLLENVDEIITEQKKRLIRQIHRTSHRRHVPLERPPTMDMSIGSLREYLRSIHEEANTALVIQGANLGIAFGGLIFERANAYFNPINVDLSGLGKHLLNNASAFEAELLEMYDTYGHMINLPVWARLLLAIGATAGRFAMSKPQNVATVMGLTHDPTPVANPVVKPPNMDDMLKRIITEEAAGAPASKRSRVSTSLA